MHQFMVILNIAALVLLIECFIPFIPSW